VQTSIRLDESIAQSSALDVVLPMTDKRDHIEEFKQRLRDRNEAITVKYGDQEELSEFAFTRNIMASSQLTSDGYSTSTKVVLEKGDIADFKLVFLKNLKQMQQELMNESSNVMPGFSREELNELLGAMIDFHLQDVMSLESGRTNR
jgi:hypothetical protein